jgi:MFS family permease
MNNNSQNSFFTKAALLLTSTLTVMSGATVSPSLPAMEDFFSQVANGGNVEILIRLVITLPALFIVIGSPIAGIIVDRIGRKPLLLAGVIFYGFAGVSGFLLHDLTSILIGRAFLGLSVACVMVSATTLIADYYLGAARATFMGLQAAFMGLGGVIFLSLGGALASVSWRYPFLIYLFSWLLIPLVIFSIYEPRRLQTEAQTTDNQQVSNNASLPVNLLLMIFGITTFIQVIFYLIPVQLPFYLRGLVNATPQQSGIAIACCTLFSATASLFYGKLRAKLDFVSILPIIFGLLGIGYGIIGLVNSYILVLFGLAIAGLGLGLLMPNMTVWVSAAVPDAIRGRALGGLSTALFLGQFLSPIITQPISLKIGLGSTYSYAGALLLIVGIVFFVMRQQVTALTVSRT